MMTEQIIDEPALDIKLRIAKNIFLLDEDEKGFLLGVLEDVFDKIKEKKERFSECI